MENQGACLILLLQPVMYAMAIWGEGGREAVDVLLLLLTVL